jgi:uncharacterized repeat protein (TIGR01451 family)
MKHRDGPISARLSLAVPLALVLAMVVIPGLARTQGPGLWTEYSGNPVIDPSDVDAYYPSVLYDDAATPFGGHGETNAFKMWHDNNLQYRISADGMAWTRVGDMLDGTITGLPPGQVRHPLVEYYASGFPGRNDGANPSADNMYYRLWFWHTAYLYGVSAIHYAESPDGKSWYNVQPLQTGSVPIVTGVWPDWNRGSYGPCDVLYNPGASNSGTDWTFWMYYDGTTGGDEGIGLSFSADGVTWTGYDSNGDGSADAVLTGTDVLGDWDADYVSRATVWREGPADYRMWYSAGIGAMHDGLGYATSPDGLTWTRDPGNPIFHRNDTAYPNYPWRQNRSYTPMVLRAGTLWLMWYSGEDGGGKTIGVAYASAQVPTPLVEIQKSVQPARILVGQEAVFTILVTNSTSDTAYNVVVSDQIHHALEIGSVQSTKGTISAEGQVATVAIEQMLPGETVTIIIRIVALRPARINNVITATMPGGENSATAELEVVSPPEEEEFVPEAGSLLLVGGGLLTLAGYARSRYRKL